MHKRLGKSGIFLRSVRVYDRSTWTKYETRDNCDQLTEMISLVGRRYKPCCKRVREDRDVQKWNCSDCYESFCDKCKYLHMRNKGHFFNYQGNERKFKFNPIIKTCVSNFKPETYSSYDNTVQRIRTWPGKNGIAWFTCGTNPRIICSHDENGECCCYLPLGSWIQDFVVTTNTKIIFIKKNDKSLWRFLDRDNADRILGVHFVPNRLFLTSGGDLLICALSTRESQGSPLIKLSRSSQKSVIHVEQSLNLGDVYDLSQSANETICLMEKGEGGQDFGRVVGLGQDGRLVFEYGGPGSLNPSGIACDCFGFIYISDCGSHSVHVITETGEFHSFLLPPDSVPFPEAIAVGEDGKLWLWNGHKKINLYELESEA